MCISCGRLLREPWGVRVTARGLRPFLAGAGRLFATAFGRGEASRAGRASWALLLAVVAGCAALPGDDPMTAPLTGRPWNASLAELQAHRGQAIHVGDWLSINVAGDPERSAVVKVPESGKNAGVIEVPALGRFRAQGISAEALAAMMERVGGRTVTVGIFTAQPLYAIGEVTQAGAYPFQDGMTLGDLIEKAGGLTYKADRRTITLIRFNQPGVRRVRLDEPVTLMPGDVVRVPQRYF